MTNIILCGGSGTRLWPLSRSTMPKQFVDLFGGHTLFQKTIERNKLLCEKSMIVTNQEHYFMAQDQYEGLKLNRPVSYLLEPIGRNTAPAIALACLSLDPEETVLVTPSDHIISNQALYESALMQAEKLAQSDALVTFGIQPTSPETGYGYIESEGNTVKAFHEKPDMETAKKYFLSETFLWNSGMFCFKAGSYLKQLKIYAPKIYEASLAAYAAALKKDVIRVSLEAMEAIPSDSIDYAVMEKSSLVAVVRSEFEWNDLGSFDSLEAIEKKDENLNTCDEYLLSINAKNNFVSTNKRLMALLDVDDLIVVDTEDALLITKKGSSQQIKSIVERLKEQNSPLIDNSPKVHRPWGSYHILEETEGYKLKTLVVKPGKRLSLQKHFHRSEHWTVLSGTATVTIDEKSFLVRPNESTYIPMGSKHRLANEGKIDLTLIEAQVGEYTGEDDIVRFDDDFDRGEK